MHVALLSSFPEPLAAYICRLRKIADSADPSPLLAHAYVRYMGDLSGGQIIRRRLAKAYGLELSNAGSGLDFYDFKELGGSQRANMPEVKRIKDWFRDGMNAGVGNDPQLKGVTGSLLKPHPFWLTRQKLSSCRKHSPLTICHWDYSLFSSHLLTSLSTSRDGSSITPQWNWCAPRR